MPAQYTIDKAHRTVYMTITGKLDMGDVKEVVARLRNDPDFDPDFKELVDGSQMQLPNLFYDDFKAISDSVDPFSEKSRRAIVAPEGVLYGISRMYQMIRGGENTRVFNDREKALAWLEADGIDQVKV
jgi:hypothetical protein